MIMMAILLQAGVAADGKQVPPSEGAGVVKLVATLHEGPTFAKVTWFVYRLDNIYRPVRVVPRHMVTLNLKPGSYKVTARMDEIERSRMFDLSPNSEREVVIPMD